MPKDVYKTLDEELKSMFIEDEPETDEAFNYFVKSRHFIRKLIPINDTQDNNNRKPRNITEFRKVLMNLNTKLSK